MLHRQSIYTSVPWTCLHYTALHSHIAVNRKKKISWTNILRNILVNYIHLHSFSKSKFIALRKLLFDTLFFNL